MIDAIDPLDLDKTQMGSHGSYWARRIAVAKDRCIGSSGTVGPCIGSEGVDSDSLHAMPLQLRQQHATSHDA